MELVAERWVRKIEGARADGADLDYIEIHYEDLVRDTEPQLRRVAEFLELPCDDSMLRYYERAEERLAEMHRDLPGDEGKPLRPADHRRRPTCRPRSRPTPAASPAGRRTWRRRHRRLRERRRAAAARARLRGRRRRVSGSAPARRRARRGQRSERPPRSSRDPPRRRGASTRREPPAPFVVGLTRSGTTLLRMMLDAHPRADDPARDPLPPRPDQGGPGRAGHRGDARGDHLEPDLGRLRHRRGGDARAPRRRRVRRRRRRGSRVLRRLRRASRASRAGATRHPPTCSPCSGSGGPCPSRASST